LTDAQLERLAENAKPPAERSSKSVGPVHKVSVRDIAWVIARGECGATTVAATAFIAARHGIRVFATGGIGGVHKDGHISMDISADLQIMSQINIAIVCAGAKSILDLPRTLEYLETAGVNVVGYGTKEFPAFFTRTSGLQLECSANNATEVATMLHHSLQMGVRSATLVCVPISAADAADGAIVQDAISKAMREADEQNVHGKAVTPFLLKRIAQLTKGVSLRANVALLKQNAKVAGQIASQLANVQQSGLSPRARY
jgi:pseudouridine-5'-phosphate glycosidase